MANTKVTSAVIEAGAILNTHIASGAITSGHLSGINTAAVAEGTNLYYTDARARASISVTGGNLSYDNSTGVLQLTDAEIRDAISATSSGDGSLTYTAGTGVIAYTGPSASEVQAHLSAGTGVTYSGGAISIGQAVGTSDTVSFGNITTAGYLRGPANFTIDPAGYADNTGTLIIAGNLQVDGTTTTINSTTLTVDDLNLTLASGAANAAAANGAGITVDGASATLLYAASGDKFVFNKGLDVTGNIGVTGTVDGVDIAARDAILTSTTTTAGAALPLAGGTLTGNLTVGGTFTAEAVGQHNFKSTSYAILNLQTDTDDNGSSDDGIFKITNGSAGTTKAELRWDESEDLVHVSYGDHGRHVSINSTGKVGIGTGSTSPTETLDVAGTALVENAKLKAIAESKTDTAVDVFVYDTRKDSDGGAWRKRTQNTSWYNETLNTSTRGARKEFPSVAVIVAEADTITIYDGDDPDMPMWMVFNSGNYYFIGPTNRTKTSAHMLNGILCVGTINNSAWMSYVSFVDDTARQYSSIAGEKRKYLVPIFNRNDAANSGAVQNSIVAHTIINDNVNDVAMTVLPNAPIDADTGLPVPTIAIGTAGGTSVITDSGNVYDISGFSPTTSIEFYGSKLAFSTEVSSTTYITVGSSTLSSDISVQNWRDYKGEYNSSGTQGIEVLTDMADHLAYGNAIYSAGVNGLTAIDHNDSDATLSMGAIINSDYNTGWMNGDIKLATLSDTDTTNATSANMVGNGNFANTNVWYTANGASFSVSGNVGTITGNGSTVQAYIGQTVSGLTVGKQYMITCDARRGTTSAQAAITVNGILSAATTSTSFTPLHVTFTATATSQLVLCFMNGTGSQSGTALFQNFTFRLAEADRSVNGASPNGGNGVQVFGTVTKTAVATGAELVAYSGFTTSNYLRQPYNSDLDFGTGDFSIACWVKQDSSSTGRIMDREGGTNDNYLIIFTSSGAISISTKDGGASINLSAPTSPFGVWQFVTVVRSGGILHLYIDGASAVTPVANTHNVTNTIAPLFLGIRTNLASPFSVGSLANFRISATAPSEEQIIKMYNDEKHLFTTNAKATLYGTSDAVTALAYDDDTELLHVGTSAGRSVFQGLNRVDNTTDAVGAAISASNGLVAED